MASPPRPGRSGGSRPGRTVLADPVAAAEATEAMVRRLELIGAAVESERVGEAMASIRTVLTLFAADTPTVRLLTVKVTELGMVEALVAGPVVVERYDAAIRSLVPYLEAGREGRSPEVLARLSPTTEEALVGGMVSLISRRIIAGGAR